MFSLLKTYLKKEHNKNKATGKMYSNAEYKYSVKNVLKYKVLNIRVSDTNYK